MEGKEVGVIMNDNNNKLALLVGKYGGLVIGLLIGILVLLIPVIYDFFKVFFIIGVCAWAGHYFQNNKTKVKEYLKMLIEKM